MNPKTEGVACANPECTYNSCRHEQNCGAETADHKPYLPECPHYTPDTMDMVVELNSPRPCRKEPVCEVAGHSGGCPNG